MNAPSRGDFYMRENATFRTNLYVTTASGPVNFTGWTLLKLHLRRAGQATAEIQLAQVATDVQGVRPFTAQPAVVLDGVSYTSWLGIKIDPATIAAIADSSGSFEMTGDLQGTDPAADKVVLLDITAYVVSGVTS